MECSKVHDERPSCSTSGGQSDGGPGIGTLFKDFPTWEKSAKELHDRQLREILAFMLQDSREDPTVCHPFPK